MVSPTDQPAFLQGQRGVLPGWEPMYRFRAAGRVCNKLRMKINSLLCLCRKGNAVFMLLPQVPSVGTHCWGCRPCLGVKRDFRGVPLAGDTSLMGTGLPSFSTICTEPPPHTHTQNAKYEHRGVALLCALTTDDEHHTLGGRGALLLDCLSDTDGELALAVTRRDGLNTPGQAAPR